MGIWSDSWCSHFGWEVCRKPLDLGGGTMWQWRFTFSYTILYNNPGLTHVLEMLGSLLQSNLIIRIHWRIWTIEFKASHAFDLSKGRQKSEIIGAKSFGKSMVSSCMVQGSYG